MSTSILGYLWMMNNLDNESEEYRKTALKEFQDELIKSMKGKTPMEFEIKWELHLNTLNPVIEVFAREQNEKNGYQTYTL